MWHHHRQAVSTSPTANIEGSTHHLTTELRNLSVRDNPKYKGVDVSEEQEH